MSIYVEVAKTRKQRELCYKVRSDVFIKETNYLQSESESALETDAYDELPTTVHFLAYYNDTPAGTVRLIFPNKEVAVLNGTNFGLPMEELYNIGSYAEINTRITEISRSSVKASFQGTKTIFYLWDALSDYAISEGITDLVTNVNPETDSLCDAYALYDHLIQKNLLHKDISVTPRKPGIGKVRRFRFPLYNHPYCTNRNAVVWKDIKLPTKLRLFTKIGYLFTGEPVYSEKIDMCALPMNVDPRVVRDVIQNKILRRNKKVRSHAA